MIDDITMSAVDTVKTSPRNYSRRDGTSFDLVSMTPAGPIFINTTVADPEPLPMHQPRPTTRTAGVAAMEE
ncbi:MAG: hypothetical protein JWO59_2556 [Chloroflexi bacterium]|nr:hypothetical protein [Chloroflexota bacterium]